MASLPPPSATPWVLDTNRDPPVYTRPMVASELYAQRYWNKFDADSEICMGINFTSSLGVEEVKDRARGALDKLRFVCPIIACTVEDVMSPRWIYTPSADRQAWLNLALAVVERGSSLNPSEFVQSIGFKRLPYTDENGTAIFLRAYLLTTSNGDRDDGREYGLYFHAIHSIIDAGPALYALNLMCEWMSDGGMEIQIKPEEEWKNLPVDPITATGGPSEEWDTHGRKLLGEFAEQSARTTPCHTLPPPSRPLNMSDPPFHYTTTVSELETARIVAQAKKLGVSVSALFHAAYSLAQFKMNPVPETVTEVDFSTDAIIASLERYMRPHVDPRTHFISSLTMLPSRISMAQPLMERSERGRLIMTAKLLQERFDRLLSNPCLPHLFSVIASMPPAEVEPYDISGLAGKAQTGAAPVLPWCCMLNNLGIIENRLQTQHRHITVESVCLGSRLRFFINVHMWTMHSKFYIQIQGATAWGEECIKTLLAETIKIASLVLDES